MRALVFHQNTFINAINAGFYSSWPGLSALRVRKHLKKSESTISSHMKLIRCGICLSNKKCTKKHSVGVMLLDPKNEDDLKNLIAMDLPSRFPITLASGNKYIFVMLDYDADYIQATPMKSRKKEEIIR